jgi:WD40 repeat protein
MPKFSSVVTVGGFTTYVNNLSPRIIEFTGTASQSLVLPDATTLTTGFSFLVINKSTGSITVKNFAATSLLVVAAGQYAEFICADISISAGVWDILTQFGASKTLYIDNNRIDSYTADGSISKPYKTIMSAVNYAASVADSTIGFTFDIANGDYVENIILENSGLYNLIFLGHNDTLIEPASGNAFQSSAKNSKLGYLFIDGIDCNGNISITGASATSFNNGLYIKNCYFYSAFAFACPAISSALFISRDSYYGGNVSLTNCAFNKSGDKFITGSYDQTCKVWDTQTGNLEHTLKGHKNVVYALSFNLPYGDKIATGSFDMTAKVST